MNEKGVEDTGIKMYNDLVDLASLKIIYNKTIIQKKNCREKSVGVEHFAKELSRTFVVNFGFA